ncbi:MAG: hypothetical protein HZB55_14965 [Deltaproteobacteria bacterium]|nr:hypothetical protein [Deltaproteobacteria bacterium]
MNHTWPGNVRELLNTLRRAAIWTSDSTVTADLVVVTPEELERHRDRTGTIVRPAAREGQLLYARSL